MHHCCLLPTDPSSLVLLPTHLCPNSLVSVQALPPFSMSCPFSEAPASRISFASSHSHGLVVELLRISLSLLFGLTLVSILDIFSTRLSPSICLLGAQAPVLLSTPSL